MGTHRRRWKEGWTILSESNVYILSRRLAKELSFPQLLWCPWSGFPQHLLKRPLQQNTLSLFQYQQQSRIMWDSHYKRHLFYVLACYPRRDTEVRKTGTKRLERVTPLMLNWDNPSVHGYLKLVWWVHVPVSSCHAQGPQTIFLQVDCFIKI